MNPNLESRQQRLETLISQLSSSPNRDSYTNRQILITAKLCLHHLRNQIQRERNSTMTEREYLNNYFSYGQRYDRSLFDTNASASTSASTTPSSIMPLTSSNHHSSSSFAIDACNSNSPPQLNTTYDYYFHHQHAYSNINEQPPSYESLMTKSSSLPSYCNVSINPESKNGLNRLK